MSLSLEVMNFNMFSNMLKDMLNKHSIQDLARVLLATFSKIYSENQERSSEWKDLKIRHVIRKGVN